jgi:fimbrial chaperone protein
MGALLLATSALVAPSMSSAQAFSIVPVAQDFEPTNRNPQEVLFIQNTTNDDARLNLQVLTRSVGPDGREINGRTADFTVSPQEAVLAPGQVQVVRLQWNGAASPDKELAYRVVAEQTPVVKAAPAGQPSAIRIATRYVGPVYVVPAGARPEVIVESARRVSDRDASPVLEVVLANRGSAHALIDEPAMTVTAGGATRTLTEQDLQKLSGENILGGSKLTFRMPWPANMPAAEPKVDFKYTANR